jgi:hypothetical protein
VYNNKILKSLPLILLALFASPFLASQVHAATGVVCVAKPGSTTCPSLPQTFGGAVGSTISVAIMAQGSDPYNSLDVSVLANSAIINATSVTLGPSFGVLAQECINNKTIVSSCSATDGPGVVHVVGGSFQPVSTTAVLFTITYQVLGTTGAAGTPIGYVTGARCTGTSVPNTCVTLINPTTATPDSETVQTGVFNNAKSDFALVADPASFSVMQGFSGSSVITADSLGNFAGSVSLTSAISPTMGAPTPSLTPTSVSLVTGGTASSTLTVSAATSTALGSYTVTVTGSGTNSTGQTVTHSVNVAVTVVPLAVPVFVKGLVHWTHHVKVSSGGIQTFEGIVNNLAPQQEFVQIVVNGASDIGSGTFTAKSAPTLLTSGQTLTISATSTFGATQSGKWSFTATLIFGSSLDASGNIVSPTTSPTAKSGSFAVA